jgi:hypothetical protein
LNVEPIALPSLDRAFRIPKRAAHLARLHQLMIDAQEKARKAEADYNEAKAKFYDDI